MTLARVVESLLFSAQKPLSAKEMVDVIKRAGQVDELSPNEFAKVRESEVAAAVEELKIEYGQQERAFQLVEKAEGWQLATDPAYANWVRQLFPVPKPARLPAVGTAEAGASRDAAIAIFASRDAAIAIFQRP